MACRAAIMSGKGIGALATVLITGDQTLDLLGKLIPDQQIPGLGQIKLVTLQDQETTIDQVTLACETPTTYAIHSHGNPLIVEQIAELLCTAGAELVTPEALSSIQLTQQGQTTLDLEIRLALSQVKTLQGARLLHHQRTSGLLPMLASGIAPHRTRARARSSTNWWALISPLSPTSRGLPGIGSTPK
jgi:hypothetical protein